MENPYIGINLRDWYIQKQVMDLLNMPYRQQIKRWRLKHRPTKIQICGWTYFLRTDVNRIILETNATTFKQQLNWQARFIEQRAYDIDLTVWLPGCWLFQHYWPHEKNHLLNLTRYRTALPSIRTKFAYRDTWQRAYYNKHDIDRWLHVANTMSTDTYLRLIKSVEPSVLKALFQAKIISMDKDWEDTSPHYIMELFNKLDKIESC